MRIQDEFGHIWLVEARDPARELVLELGRRGLTFVVLPCYTLRTGLLPGGPVSGVPGINNTRMQDCLVALKGT